MTVNFPNTEEDVLRFWKEIDAFQTQLRLTENGPRFTFYDGPPFATGLPHYGHLLASTIKDIIPRYWSMKGHHVVRRFGWDTHGLPVEHEVNKKLNISSGEAVLQMGIDKYNSECKKIVMTYASEWRQVVERLGRWIDFDNDYKSMDVTFMESCWCVFKRLYDDGQVYRAYQIMPFSTALGTPLSHMEERQNEKSTVDPAVVVAFPVLDVKGQQNTSLLTYTTTPWTLPSNLLVAVNPDLEYVKVLDEKTGTYYILLESYLPTLYKDTKAAKYKVVQKVLGKDMVGWKYKPLFEFFVDRFPNCFEVILADYVEAGEGTGLVHQAPAFGQEDYDAAYAAGFITKEHLPPCPVDAKGCFTDEVPDYEGQHVKVADKAIIRDLRPTGRLLLESQVTHTDKFCPRSDTQLIRKAISAWFIKVKNSTPEILDNLERTTWVPQSVKDKRFANWVSNSPDWNVSRNRYWGTPLPLWVSDDYEEVVCVGSREELRRLSGYEGSLEDIHRDKIDHITIPSRQGKGVLRRVDEVFDCWFESGSMPYASNHYPFENEHRFEQDLFPADFIAEGLDQTRGWFYSLTVLGNKLFNRSPFKNCIVNGLVLAEDGKKMSKSLKNFPNPMHVLNNYGSDALRLYLINSPVVRSEPLRFKESGVKEIVSRVLLPLWNSYRFFSEQALLFKSTTGTEFVAKPLASLENGVGNVMDRWILADCQSLLLFMDHEMLGYRLYTVVPRLLKSIENLSNWYIRFNRQRLKGTANLGTEDTTAALNTLFQVLFTLTCTMAPFAPFITEHMYSFLRPLAGDMLNHVENTASVHFLPFPQAQKQLLDPVVERKMSALQKVTKLTRTARERRSLGLRSPLKSLVVVADPQFIADVHDLQSYVTEELSVAELLLTSDAEQYNIRLEAKVDWPTLGKKLKKDVQRVRKGLPSLSQNELKQYQRDKCLVVDGIQLVEGDLTIVRVAGNNVDSTVATTEGQPTWEPSFDEDVVVLLDVTSYPELERDGLVHDLISRFQKLRKKAGLTPLDTVQMQYQILSNPESVDVGALVSSRLDAFQSALRGRLERVLDMGNMETLVEEEWSFGSLTLSLRLCPP